MTGTRNVYGRLCDTGPVVPYLSERSFIKVLRHFTSTWSGRPFSLGEQGVVLMYYARENGFSERHEYQLWLRRVNHPRNGTKGTQVARNGLPELPSPCTRSASAINVKHLASR